MLYIDKDKPLPEKSTNEIIETAKEVEKYYDEKDDSKYWQKLDELEMYTKEAYIDGKISFDDTQIIFKKFGFA